MIDSLPQQLILYGDRKGTIYTTAYTPTQIERAMKFCERRRGRRCKARTVLAKGVK